MTASALDMHAIYYYPCNSIARRTAPPQWFWTGKWFANAYMVASTFTGFWKRYKQNYCNVIQNRIAAKNCAILFENE